MGKAGIDPMASVDPEADIGKNVTIEPFAVVKGTVTLEDGVVVKSHAYLDGNTTIGEGTVIWPGVAIGTRAQDLKSQDADTYVRIGRGCQIREYTTINSSCGEGSTVSVGDNCLIMACCHIAHQCTVGDNVIMSNNAILAGHVEVEDQVVVGGMTAVHQFVRIGRNSMVGGMSRITHDVPPYCLVAGIPPKMGGLNMVGLKRRGFPLEVRKQLSRCYRLLYRSGLHYEEALDQIRAEVELVPEVQHWLGFCEKSKRGLICLQGVSRSTSKAETPTPEPATV